MRSVKFVFVLFTIVFAACLGAEDPAPSTQGDSKEPLSTLQGGELGALAATRPCTEQFFCNAACACDGGFCVPDGFGPSAPQEYCNAPPARACQSGSDCRSMCDCWQGVCQPDGFGPSPPWDYCAMPPPDANEPNDTQSEANSYLGAAQTHTFHDRGDVDWIHVYFGYAGNAIFETSHLSGPADTYMSLYRWDAASASYVFVADNDNKCTWWATFCWGSRIRASVPANSTYAVRIVNQGDGAMSVYDQEAPSYSFTVGF